MFDVKRLAAIKVGLASPEAIRSWSHGTTTLTLLTNSK